MSINTLGMFPIIHTIFQPLNTWAMVGSPNQIFILKKGTPISLYSGDTKVGSTYAYKSIEYRRCELEFTKPHFTYRFHKPYPTMFAMDITSIEWIE